MKSDRKEYFKQYRIANRELLNERSRLAMSDRRTRKAKKRIRCVCCNKSFWSMRSDAKYCAECKKIVKHVEIKAIRSKLTVDDSIAVSDFLFDTDKCNMDCLNCKFNDCILPED